MLLIGRVKAKKTAGRSIKKTTKEKAKRTFTSTRS